MRKYNEFENDYKNAVSRIIVYPGLNGITFKYETCLTDGNIEEGMDIEEMKDFFENDCSWKYLVVIKDVEDVIVDMEVFNECWGDEFEYNNKSIKLTQDVITKMMNGYQKSVDQMNEVIGEVMGLDITSMAA